MNYRFGFTGTRHGMTEPQKIALRDFLRGSQGEFHHGDCLGADSEAHDIADECGYAIVIHPPSNYKERAWREVPLHMMRSEKPYMTRNRDIVVDTIALIGCPAEAIEQSRGGTWSTIRFGLRQGRTVIVINPSGKIIQRDSGIAA